MERAEPPSLSTQDHARDAAGLRYVYPVLSRRAGGVSIGINLNTNNACNWACEYCQVPGLTRGGPEPIDLARLKTEFEQFLEAIFYGRFLIDRVPEGQRRVVDVAFSGNGEPTAAPEFGEALALVEDALKRIPEASNLKCVVISNGSHALQQEKALKRLRQRAGELWFKLDRGTEAERRDVNGVIVSDDAVVRRLSVVSHWIPTWIQTCVYGSQNGQAQVPDIDAYRRLIGRIIEAGAVLEGVQLYTLARPSRQPGGDRLRPVEASVLAQWAEGLPIPVRISL